MRAVPTFKLSRLRDTGWSQWDPIGLAGPNGSWPEEAADEYESYLLRAAAKLWNGQSVCEVADFFVEIETDYMGLGTGPALRERALAATHALRAYVESTKPR